MLRSDLCDFDDAYIVVEGKITASFNPRKDHYGANDLTDNLFPNRIFLSGSTAERITVAGNAAKTAAVNVAKVFLLKTMLHLSTAFRKLMDH